jgi:hypothetical protein
VCLQAATTSGRPVVLRVEAHGGHGLGSTRDQESALLADELAFLLHAFGMDDPDRRDCPSESPGQLRPGPPGHLPRCNSAPLCRCDECVPELCGPTVFVIPALPGDHLPALAG